MQAGPPYREGERQACKTQSLGRLVKLDAMVKCVLGTSPLAEGKTQSSKGELGRWREENRTCQSCKLRGEETSIPGVVTATLGCW